MRDKEYKVYVMDTRAFSDAGVFDVCLGKVSEYRRGKVRRLRMQNDRQSSLAAGLLLEAVLEKYAGIAVGRITYTKNPKGKLGIDGMEDIGFSISHTDGCVAVILGSSPCGIDVEGLRRMPDNIVERLFSDKDIGRLACMADDEECAAVYGMSVWTRREACGKMTGTGILMSDETQKMVMDDEYMMGKHILLQNYYVCDGEIYELCCMGSKWREEHVPDHGYMIAVCVPNELEPNVHIEYVDSVRFTENLL